MNHNNERTPLVSFLQPEQERPKCLTPATVVSESCALVPLAWPVSVGCLLQMSLNFAAIIALGRLGTTALASMALTSLYANVTGYSLILGMGAAIDTLCSQAYGEFVSGSGDKKDLGRHLTRTILVMYITTIPIAILWLFTKDLLLLAGQDPTIAELSGKYTKILIPSLFPFVISESVKRFLMAQGIMSAQMLVMCCVTPINCVLQYIFVFSRFKLDDTGSGAPFALTISQTLVALLLVLYSMFVNGGDAFAELQLDQLFNTRKLRIVVELAISGVFMTCSEWWAWEIVALCAGLLGPEYLAAQTIIITICSWAYMIPLGVSIACTTRIGNALGAKSPDKAKLTAFVSLFFLGSLLAAINSSLLVFGRSYFGRIFSDDEHVLEIVSSILPLGAAFQVADVMSGISGGILRGAGRPEIGACLNLVGYYVVGIPLGVFCCFVLDMKMVGLWVGLTAALFTLSGIEMVIIVQLDWEKESDNARMRCLDHLNPCLA
ncbi:hypothetical protein HK100_000939 [Physocladia obscura]|uniref:Multidrug and toxic compound extrusion protein n=1 Tax=Physocladia obscura TaxID=109957 RepID=A0AAD5T3L4_9FUNG|nr:hypothetical protein HK100_000939 [Physocladia obscura]